MLQGSVQKPGHQVRMEQSFNRSRLEDQDLNFAKFGRVTLGL